MKPIYALSGYAEWFWLMAKNYKDIENRDWPLFRYIKQLPVRIYLHASKKPASGDEKQFIWDTLQDADEFAEFNAVKWDKLRGTIIGEITITGQVTESESPWFFGKFGYIVKDGILYEKSIPYKGQLGFWKPEF